MNNDNKLNSIDNQEDFFSFGDFTSDELNIYLNKSNNNTTTPTTTTSNNLNELKSNSFKATKTNFIPNINTNCNSFLHGVEVPWHINNNNKEENINNKQIFEFRSNSITSPSSSSSSKREESKSSSNNSSSLSSPFDSFDSSNKLIKMNTQITTNSNDLAAQAAANEAAQQRRNKKKKPPNYYENPEYKDILKTTTDESTTITNPSPTTNTTTTTLINSITSNNNNNESSNDLKKESVVNNLDNQIINNISAKLLNSNINEIKTNNLNNSEHHHHHHLNNINKNESENIVNEPEEEKKQPQKEVLKTNDLEIKLTNQTKTTQSNDNSQDKSNNNTTNSSSKCWSSLFKSSAAASAATTTTTVTLPPVPVSQNNNNNNKQTKVNHNNSKPSLSSSASLPISPSSSVSSSSSSLSSSTTHNNTNNHVHLNGTTTTTNNNNNNIAATSASSEQFSHDVLKMLGTMFKQCELKHSAPALQPRGIRNKQNWCYVNATLQALLACPPFYNLIKSIFMKIKSSNTNIKNVPCIAALGRFISEFKTMVRLQPQNDKQSNNNNSSSSNFSNYKELVIGEPFENEFFYETLANLKAELTFKTGRQEDAQEFLSFLLNRLHDEMVRCLESLNATNNETNNNIDHSKTNGSSVHNNNNHQDEQQADEDDEWKEVGKKNRSFVTRKTEFKQSPLSDIFCGQFRSALSQPGVKDKESVSLEPFFTLPLDIQPDSVRNVQQALEHFVQKEEVFGFTNQDTKQEIEAFKRISFEDLPPVLILYLKCFVFDKQGGIQKLIKRIDFQIDLEINKELISPNQRSKLRDKKRNYKLFAVEYHQGDKANGGHYITDVYHPGIIGWVRYDDANVKVINNAQVLKSEDKKLIPYLLYYRRADLI